MADTVILDYNEKNNSGKIVKKKKTVTVENVMLCSDCHIPKLKKNLMKCSSKDCRMMLCKSCATMLNTKPFCRDCIVDFVQNKVLFILEK